MRHYNAQKILKFLFLGLVGFVIIRVYFPWIINSPIIAGDWPYFFRESLQSLGLFSPSWSATYGNGLGGPVVNYSLDQYQHFTAFLTRFYGTPWVLVYKIFWFLPVVLFSIYATIRLYKTIFEDREILPPTLAALIYVTNTYILMVTTGGQMGVALAYAFAPLVLTYFVILARAMTLRNMIIAGLVLALQVMLDLRVSYITLIAVSLYYLMRVSALTLRRIFWILFSIGIPLLMAIMAHASWTFPLLFLRQNPFESLGQSYTASGMVKFLSFADFSHSLSLLHPNWPENIFGKIYFMQPEFLVLPILAFGSLLFMKASHRDQRKKVFFLAVLALVGSFLGKGANPPLGELYILAFEKVPGFVMFRDPTKFYILVSLAFSLLIPFTLSRLSLWLKKRYAFSSTLAVLLVFTAFVLLWGISIREAVQGNLEGTFSKRSVPNEYIQLKDFLYSQPSYFRVLMAPRWHRFVFNSDMHPLVDASYLFDSREMGELAEHISKSQDYLSELSIRYIIVPDDSLGEIFLKDRKYDDAQYESMVKSLEKIPWIKKVFTAGKIIVFETQYRKDRFWLDGENSSPYTPVDSTKYIVDVNTPASSTLNFSESHSPNWTAYANNQVLTLTRSKYGLMQLALGPGTYNVTLAYGPEKYYLLGRYISFGTLTAMVLYLLVSQIYTKRQSK